jgi:hypothetical protein
MFNISMGLEDAKDIIDIDFPEPGPITDETVRAIQEHSQNYGGGTVREATGRIFTDEAYEQMRREVLSNKSH